MSLSASLAALLDATVIYYGRVNKLAAGLKPLVGQVKGYFATKDEWINGKLVGGCAAAMAGKSDQHTL
jgi:carboxymethylenebutenolidase